MKRLIEALLNDDHGISEDAYNALLDYCNNLRFQDDALGLEMYNYVASANATDGRFYFSK